MRNCEQHKAYNKADTCCSSKSPHPFHCYHQLFFSLSIFFGATFTRRVNKNHRGRRIRNLHNLNGVYVSHIRSWLVHSANAHCNANFFFRCLQQFCRSNRSLCMLSCWSYTQFVFFFVAPASPWRWATCNFFEYDTVSEPTNSKREGKFCELWLHKTYRVNRERETAERKKRDC